jgi:heptosyltransferase II
LPCYPPTLRMKPDTKRHSIPSRIVVRGTNWVGDTIMSFPAAREIRRIFPSAALAFWVPSGLKNLVEATGIPDEILSFDVNSGRTLTRPFRMRGRLASGEFDAAILLQNAFESAFTAWLAGISIRVGYPTDLRGPFLNLKAPLTPEIREKHQVFYYLGITDFIDEYFFGRKNTGLEPPDCSIPIPTLSLDMARDLLTSHGVDPARPIFTLCPGSVNSEAKRWPAEYFARLADLLRDHAGTQIVFLGAPSENSLIGTIQEMMKGSGSLNLAGKADMLTSMAVMHISKAVISNDTGSAHLAVAASATVLTVFGPTSAGATAPYGPGAHIIQGRAPCAPCRHFRCPLPGHPCMRSVLPEMVIEKVQQILSHDGLRETNKTMEPLRV